MTDSTATDPDPGSTADSPTPNRFRRRLRRLLIVVLSLGVIAVAVAAVMIPRLNQFQTDGELTLPGLQESVTIVRDEKGMPYIHAENLHDLIYGQGFAAAQDRMFQMHLMKLKAAGRLTELAGDIARDVDIRTRTIGITRAAQRHAGILNDTSRDAFQAYADGVNAFLDQCPDDLHIEFALAGLTAERWTVEDSLSLLYLMSWDTSANLNHEVVGQMLIDRLGADRAQQLWPRNINPDAPQSTAGEIPTVQQTAPVIQGLGLAADDRLADLLTTGSLRVGSNNWVASPRVSAGDHATLAGDPHLDPRMLPGIMYAAGYIAPDIRAVGAGVPGIPGFIIGRNEHVATAVTNNYGDVQDLYVETLDPEDPDRYLESGQSLPFRMETQTLKIKDADAPDGFRTEETTFRFTSRGPVVSGLLPGLDASHVVTLRWAAAESMQPNTGLTDLLTARSVTEVDSAIESVTSIVLNFVIADADGNIGWRASGRLPRRRSGGTLPFVVDPQEPQEDNWDGWIPFAEMPHIRNPERGWLGTANHYTVPPDYPHYYSNYAAPSYRYRRLKERVEAADAGLTTDDHWSIQRDTKNLMAAAVTPKLIEALSEDPETEVLASVLKDWDFHDDTGQAGTTVFQSVYAEFAKATFQDELGDELTKKMLGNWYFWHERFQQLLESGDHTWFDDQSTTDTTESAGDMIRRGGKAALARWAPQLGADPHSWNWGRVHTIEFVNPIRRDGLGSTWLGTGPLPVSGSGETLYRGRHSFGSPFEVAFCAALRMVVDFGDSDKVQAVLAGGSTGRTFHPHQKDQIQPFLDGTPRHWWFSDKAINDHAKSRLKLVPANAQGSP